VITRAAGPPQFPKVELPGEFGEILRHGANNPLIVILRNTELLLARRDRLSEAQGSRSTEARHKENNAASFPGLRHLARFSGSEQHIFPLK
jgi:hypothetical protein